MTNAATDAAMAPSASAPDQVLDTMISLTRITPAHRVIVAGSDSMEFYLALRRRGFIRVATPEISRVPRGQHAVGLIAGQSMLTGIEPVLVQISPFLAANAGLAVLVGSRENGLKIRNRLEQLGFRIEAGVRCRAGLVLSAYRQGYTQIEQAA
jgi:hypothetical protein